MKVGEKLHQIRKAKHLSQEEISKMLGMDQSTYSRLENNLTTVELEEAERFAKILEVPITSLLPDGYSFYNHQEGENQNTMICGGSEREKLLEQENKHLKEQIRLLKALLVAKGFEFKDE